VQTAGALVLAVGLSAGLGGLFGFLVRAVDRRRPPVRKQETVNEVYWLLGDFFAKACWPLVALALLACITGSAMLARA
jgi:hypothetical protein